MGRREEEKRNVEAWTATLSMLRFLTIKQNAVPQMTECLGLRLSLQVAADSL
jgi:hypothetical protein